MVGSPLKSAPFNARHRAGVQTTYKPVANHLPSIIEALGTIIAKHNLTNDARSEASALKQYFISFEAIVPLKTGT